MTRLTTLFARLRASLSFGGLHAGGVVRGPLATEDEVAVRLTGCALHDEARRLSLLQREHELMRVRKEIAEAQATASLSWPPIQTPEIKRARPAGMGVSQFEIRRS
jgi:hypothetical protein